LKLENCELAFEKAQLELRTKDPYGIVARSEARFEALGDSTGEFELPYFGKMHVVTFPEGLVYRRDGGKVTTITKTILLHYLLGANGSPLTGEWINFRRLPGGMLYLSAFQAQCLSPIAREFGNDVQRFLQAGEAAGGESTRMGDGSVLFRVLPRFLAICVLWLGDDEFPPAADLLFDASAPNYLSTEDIEVVCLEISERLMQRSH
jgi:hypothetical protein